MHRNFKFIILLCAPWLVEPSSAQQERKLFVKGLRAPVEIIRDEYGVNHIYAQNEHDLFFAQGYCAAKDRLFQFEMWRRQATGTVSEILGSRELKRDIGARLFKFRGNITQELNHYHPRGEQIISAFTNGINAYVLEANQYPEKLPLEFRLLKITPGLWTPDVVISRHQGLLGNLNEELRLARAVATLGPEKVQELTNLEPGEPQIELDSAIEKNLLFDPITELYEAFRKPLSFTPEDLVAAANPNLKSYRRLQAADEHAFDEIMQAVRQNIGSNNWIVNGELSQSGYPLLANDPHRALAAPSLRYMVHLNAPGWNVVGGGEPTIPGVSIGHNEDGAWGLTVFSIDTEDIYIYTLNPKQHRQYWYNGRWEDMRVINDTIKIKGLPDVAVEHLYTRHGPVTYINQKSNTAYAIRCGWLDVGAAPYLASLRMNQARTWKEFREACAYSHIPGENMIWADREGNIGWQVVGVAPIRKNWSGLVPVPGDGRYEWSGYLPIKELPNIYNPPQHFWVTANENLVPPHYPHRNAVGWGWADPYRAMRIKEVLASGKTHSLLDMMRLQCDYVSIPARTLVPFLQPLQSSNAKVEKAKQLLLNWDHTMTTTSVAAGIYMAWEKELTKRVYEMSVPEKAIRYITNVPTSKIIELLTTPGKEFGKNPIEARNALLLQALEDAVATLSKQFGTDMNQWQYGQNKYHHVLIKHPMSNAVNEATRKLLEVGPLPRGGNGSTPGLTGNSDNQTHGATFRMVVDLKNWDTCMFTNAPGQSGDPESPYYRNLFELWARDQHFPVYFSKKKVVESTAELTTLTPH